MKTYAHIFFDLDHTLWDFETNSNETIRELFDEHKLHDTGLFDFDGFMGVYAKINHQLWDDYSHGRITKAELRARRFKESFEQLGLEEKHQPLSIGQQYLERCPEKSGLFPHSIEILEYLKDKYTLSVITNGFPEAQYRKMKASGIDHYFESIVISEDVGIAKPYPGIFDHAIKSHRTEKEQCIMIGDNLETDIKGANNAGIDSVWVNHIASEAVSTATHTVVHLQDLERLL